MLPGHRDRRSRNGGCGHYGEFPMLQTYRGKVYRVRESVGFRGVIVWHVEVKTARGWRITRSDGEAARAVIAMCNH